MTPRGKTWKSPASETITELVFEADLHLGSHWLSKALDKREQSLHSVGWTHSRRLYSRMGALQKASSVILQERPPVISGLTSRGNLEILDSRKGQTSVMLLDLSTERIWWAWGRLRPRATPSSGGGRAAIPAGRKPGKSHQVPSADISTCLLGR